MDLATQEQTETTTEAPTQEASSADTPATNDDLVAAAREAMQGAKEQPAAAAADQTEQQETQTEEEPRWMRLMKEREKGQAEREAAQKAADDLTARAKAEADRIVEEARAKARAEAEADRQAWLRKYRADPESALRDVGGAEDVADKLVELNSPHGKAMAKMRAELEETREKAAKADQVAKDFEEWKAAQAKEKEQASYQQVVQTFMATHANPEKTPHLHTLYDPHEIVAKADSTATEWQKAGLRFELGDIAEYLEAKAKERLTARGFAAAQQSRAAPGQPAGNAPKSQANGSRTITAAAGSERRAAPRPFNELSPKEQQEDLLRVAREAFRQHGKT